MPPAQNHDPTLSHSTSNGGQAPPSGAPGGVSNNVNPAELPNLQLAGLDQSQIMSLLRHLPGVFTKLTEQGSLKEDAAQTLSNLAQAPFATPGNHHPLSIQHPYPGGPGPQLGGGLPGINDPGPSSHPRGPPNLGQLSAVAMQATPARQQIPGQGQMQVQPMQQGQQEMEEGPSDGDDGGRGGNDGTSATPPATVRTRGSRSATMGSDEWSRQRKDNHKEVERRRRGNINEGINELGRIVPNGSGEKAKGAILSRAVQYIHHLKENEARNIEKWTLEKLLMDQAMGDLQAQLEEVKRMWDEERMARQRLENDLEMLRNAAAMSGKGLVGGQNMQGGEAQGGDGSKRRNEGEGGETTGGEGEGGERDNKRQRTE